MRTHAITRRRSLGLIGGGAVLAACGADTEVSRDDAPLWPPARAVRPRTRPLRASGLNPEAVETANRAAEALTQLRSLTLARAGEVVHARAYRGPGLDQPTNIKSASKTLLALIAGAAIEAGQVPGLEARAVPLLGGRPDGADPAVDRITVEHLLSMRAGLQSTSGRNYGPWAVSRDPVRHALTRPMVDEPGGAVIYSTGTSHITSAVLTAASGASTLALARRYLGEPLGIDIPAWERDPTGIYYGGNNMMLSPDDLLKVGEMCRNGGVHDGHPVLSREWLEDSWRARGRSRWSGAGYGLGWWLGAVQAGGRTFPVRYAWGYGGQMLYVVPDAELTVVITSEFDPARTERGHVGQLHALMRDVIVPGMLEA